MISVILSALIALCPVTLGAVGGSEHFKLAKCDCVNGGKCDCEPGKCDCGSDCRCGDSCPGK